MNKYVSYAKNAPWYDTVKNFPTCKTVLFYSFCSFPGFIRFLDYLESREDVYVVNILKVIDWMRSPTSLANIKSDSGPLSC